MATKHLRVAVLGYGWVSKYFHIPMVSAVPECCLVRLGSARIDQTRAENPGIRVSSLEEAATADDVEVVVVATVNALHAPLTELALRAGKHVVVEKPFTATTGEAKRLLDLAESSGRTVTVFQNRRWDSDFLTVRQAIADGLLGEILHFESHFDFFTPTVKAAWREQPAPAAGTWFDLGPHLVDQAILLFGYPNRVTARFAMQREGARTDDWSHVVLDYGRLQVVLHASQVARRPADRFLVHGTRGTLVKRGSDPQEAQLLRGLKPTDDGFGVDPDGALFYSASTTDPRLIGAVRGEQIQFYTQLARALRGKGKVPVTHDEALAVMSILEAAAESAAEHRSVVPHWVRKS
jgi:predicted dehydrogenase